MIEISIDLQKILSILSELHPKCFTEEGFICLTLFSCKKSVKLP